MNTTTSATTPATTEPFKRLAERTLDFVQSKLPDTVRQEATGRIALVFEELSTKKTTGTEFEILAAEALRPLEGYCSELTEVAHKLASAFRTFCAPVESLDPRAVDSTNS